MKKIFTQILMLIVLVGLFNACSEDDFSSKYTDPSQTTTVTCEKLMTGILYQGTFYTFKAYYGIFYFETYGVSRYSQTLGYINGSDCYELPYAGINNRWENYYNLLSQFRLLEKTYNNLSEASKPDYLPFVSISKAFMLDHLLQMTDLFGDIPYSDAGTLGITNDVNLSRPTYDKATDIYQDILDGLKECNEQLSSSSLSTLTTSYLSAQDFINHGDVMQWRRYINSVRLRAALRISSQGEMVEIGKSVVKEILDDPTTYPIVESNEQNIVMTPDEDGFSYAASGPEAAYETWVGDFNRAPAAMVDRMVDDPRLEIFFDENAEGNYVGIDTHDAEDVQQAQFDAGDYYCAYDSATFSRNRLVPGIMVDAAEVSFSKAEAYQRGLASGDAKAAFVQGVTQSIEFYYGINATGVYRTPVTAPSALEMETFAESKWDNASDKLEVILTQKWLNYSWMQGQQAWAQIRRIGIPDLYFPTSIGAKLSPEVPNRLPYASSEEDNNTANYQAVKDMDNWTTKMFWAK